MYVCMYVYMCVCMYVRKYVCVLGREEEIKFESRARRERERERERERSKRLNYNYIPLLQGELNVRSVSTGNTIADRLSVYNVRNVCIRIASSLSIHACCLLSLLLLLLLSLFCWCCCYCGCCCFVMYDV